MLGGAAKAVSRTAKKAAKGARGVVGALRGEPVADTRLAGPGDGAAPDGDAAPTGEDALEEPGLGYLYLRWENFDVARVSHEGGWPTLDGERFCDGGIFKAFAMACVRVNNRRVRMRNAGRKAARRLGVLGPDAPVRSVCRTSAARTVAFCFDAEGIYKFYDAEGTPLPVEVPADQYDACLARMWRRIEDGCVPPLADADLAGVLVRPGWFTYAQARNLALGERVPNVEFREATGSVVCTRPEGLGSWLSAWTNARQALGGRMPAGAAERADQVGDAVGRALAGGAQASKAAGVTQEQAAAQQVGRFIADNAASRVTYGIGATASRVLLGAVGVASGPVAMVTSLVLGDVCGRAGTEALSMVKDLFVEPPARVFERLFGGVLANVAFEHALVPAEQTLLGELMARANPAVFQRLGAALADGGEQEAPIRALLEPMVAAIRRA